MRITVCVKQVPDTGTDRELDPGDSIVAREAVSPQLYVAVGISGAIHARRPAMAIAATVSTRPTTIRTTTRPPAR
jgi:hypothetical protein